MLRDSERQFPKFLLRGDREQEGKTAEPEASWLVGGRSAELELEGLILTMVTSGGESVSLPVAEGAEDSWEALFGGVGAETACGSEGKVPEILVLLEER